MMRPLSPPAAESRAAESEASRDRAAGSGSGGAVAQAPSAKSAAPSRDERLGTGHGEREYAPTTQTTFERASERPAEIVRLRYDSVENLLASGVIPRPWRRPGCRSLSPASCLIRAVEEPRWWRAAGAARCAASRPRHPPAGASRPFRAACTRVGAIPALSPYAASVARAASSNAGWRTHELRRGRCGGIEGDPEVLQQHAEEGAGPVHGAASGERAFAEEGLGAAAAAARAARAVDLDHGVADLAGHALRAAGTGRRLSTTPAPTPTSQLTKTSGPRPRCRRTRIRRAATCASLRRWIGTAGRPASANASASIGSRSRSRQPRFGAKRTMPAGIVDRARHADADAAEQQPAFGQRALDAPREQRRLAAAGAASLSRPTRIPRCQQRAAAARPRRRAPSDRDLDADQRAHARR
jgi:hypothetical protein